MIIETFNQLKEVMGASVNVCACSQNARIVYINGNKITLPLELKEITKEK